MNTLPEYTLQEMFDKSTLGIIAQGYQTAMDAYGRCRLLDKYGNRCAIGHLVTDPVVGNGVSTQSDLLLGRLEFNPTTKNKLAQDLQSAHDITLMHGKMEWQRNLSQIALKYGLDDSCVYWELVK